MALKMNEFGKNDNHIEFVCDHFLPPNRRSDRLIREEKQTVRHIELHELI